ncbi:restriction endonuclease subunit S [Amycolatopsis sp. NPDC052450]|uniref:restriction endonuclease subunit S n=1 Tax=Amycolatopsis sp. NPDC052450 TaxID=3363937 RepID=UPI0037CA3E55
MNGLNDIKLPARWAWARLDEVVEVLDRQRVPVSAQERAQRPGSVPYYGATGQVGWIDTALFNEELVLLGEDGVQFFDHNKAKAYRISGPTWVNNHAHVLRVRKDATLARFITHYLNIFNYEGYANGTTRLKLTKSAMCSIPVPLPPLAEQHRIVEALEDGLSRLDSAAHCLTVAQVRTRSLQRSAIARAVNGKLSAKDDRDESVDILLNKVRTQPSRTSRARHREAKPAALNPYENLPSHWTVQSLGALSLRIDYGTSAKAHTDRNEADVPVLRMGNIQDGHLDLQNLKYLPANHPDVAKLSLDDGDLLFNRTNSAELVGKSAVYRSTAGPATFASYLIRCQLARGVEPEWVSLCINSSEGRRYIRSVAAQQVGQANVNGTKLASFPIPLPPHDEQLRLLAELHEWNDQVERASRVAKYALKRSAHLRRSLLSHAFSGKLAPQDSADESAFTLLDRIRSVRDTKDAKAKSATRSPRKKAASADESTEPPTLTIAVQQELPL